MKYSTFATILLALGPVLGVYDNDLPDVYTEGKHVLQSGETLLVTGFGNNDIMVITTMVSSASSNIPFTISPSGLSTLPGSLNIPPISAVPSATTLLSTTQLADTSRTGPAQLGVSVSTPTSSDLATQASVSLTAVAAPTDAGLSGLLNNSASTSRASRNLSTQTSSSLTIFPMPINAGSSKGSAAPSSNNYAAPSSMLWLSTTTITGGPQTSSSVFVIDIDPSETTSSSLPVLSASPNILLNLSRSPVGVCGADRGQSCLGSIWGNCCGPFNLCGNTIDECGSGICQYQYGLCAVTDVLTVTVDPSTASPTHTPSFTLSSSAAPNMPPNLTRSSLVRENLTTSTSGECGIDGYTGEVHDELTCLGSPFGQCCGANGTCGYAMDTHCGKGVCQYLYGLCAAEDYITVTISSGSSSPTSTSTPVTHMLFISSDGRCGDPGVTCLGSPYGDCCSYAGACSNGSGFCQPPGCQPDFGRCDPPPADGMHKRTARVLRPARYMPRRRDW